MNYNAFLSHLVRRWQAKPAAGMPRARGGLDAQEAQAVLLEALAPHVSDHHTGLGLMRVRVLNWPMIQATYGAQRSDELMHRVQERLERAVGVAQPPNQTHAAGWVARIGEADFAVLTDARVDASAQRRLAARLCDTLNLALPLNDVLIHVHAVVGVAACDQSYVDAHELFESAGIALQSASSLGRGRWVVFERGQRESLVRRQLLENELGQALMGQEFDLAFQPIIAVDNLAHMGFEALARWQHPLRGRLLPCDFLDTAENAELVCQLDLQVMELCLVALVKWQHRQLWKPGWFMSVNLSAQHFNQPGLATQLQALVAKHAVAPGDLHLELTESAFMKNLVVARDEMERLRQAGFDIYMDDFGTGYSSLSHLHDLPFSAIKIDKCFLDPMTQHPHTSSLLPTMVEMAQRLGIQVVAEGLETLEQLHALQDMHCDLAQGHLIRAPMNHAMATVWLQSAMDPVV